MTAVARRARRAAEAAAEEPPPFPTSIRVGHRDIVVELHPSDEMDGANGDFLDGKQRIRICNDLMPQTMAEVLNHEVGHACFTTFRWTLVGDVEEQIVSGLFTSWTQIERDNPVFMAWKAWALR